jgi:hypothetical protein
MRRFNILLFLLALFMPAVKSIAQVAISDTGTIQPSPTALLELSSSTRGFLLPRLTTTEIRSIYNPSDGLLVYNTDDHSLYLFNGSESEINSCTSGNRSLNFSLHLYIKYDEAERDYC